jgi:hypothetical protein
MREEIQARLDALKKELETGQAELHRVEMQRTYLHETVLRISGAVQVLEELLEVEQHAGPTGAASSARQHVARASGTDS